MKTLKIALVVIVVLAAGWFTFQPAIQSWLNKDAGYGTGERTQQIVAEIEKLNREHEANQARIASDAAKLSSDYAEKTKRIEQELAVFKRQEQERLEKEIARIEEERALALQRAAEKK